LELHCQLLSQHLKNGITAFLGNNPQAVGNYPQKEQACLLLCLFLLFLFGQVPGTIK